jgi:hypothetical protein
MADFATGAALPRVNGALRGQEDRPARRLLFIPVQPETSGSTPKPLRAVARKHVVRNRLRESPEGVRPCSTEREAGDMRKQLSRFRLDGKHQSGCTQRTLKPLVASQ